MIQSISAKSAVKQPTNQPAGRLANRPTYNLIKPHHKCSTYCINGISLRLSFGGFILHVHTQKRYRNSCQT